MRSVSASAPGKLFLAGEHAVTEAGYPAVLVAVDRWLTLTLTESEQADPLLGREWRYVAAAGEVLAAVARVRHKKIAPFSVSTSSQLDDPGTGSQPARKYGLGSSAAATAAAVVAIDAWAGLRLTASERLRAGLLATLMVNPNASGGDVATSLTGGWVRYTAPDRGWVAARGAGDDEEARAVATERLVRKPWPGLECEAMPDPAGFDLRVGWTGEPASTSSIVTAVREAGMPPEFLSGAREAARGLADAVESADLGAAQEAIRRARAAQLRLADATGVEIETPALRTLVETAAGHGYAAKASGAGGGDCGVALGSATDSGGEGAALVDDWAGQGIVPLDLRVAGPSHRDETQEGA